MGKETAWIQAQGSGRKRHPLEGSCQEATPLPSTPFGIFPVVFRSAPPTPRVALADASVFACAWCRLPCAAPVTHQAQGLVTSRSGARRRPLASSMPQKTLGSLSCPSVYSVQLVWLPRRSTFARAHGRGVAPLGHAVAGHLYGLRPGLISTDGYDPTVPPASSLNPTASQTSAKGLRRLKGHEVAHKVIAGP